MITFLLQIALQIFLLLPASDAWLCYDLNFTSNFKGPLYPLDPYGLTGHFSGLWSNTTDGDTTYQVWLLSYNYDEAKPKSFYLSLVAIHNPSKLWDLVNPLVLWTANRDDPVHENVTLKFGDDGNLQLLDGGKSVWSTNTSNQGVNQICIDDNARIVLVNSSVDIQWSSSDDPTDIQLLQRPFRTDDKLVSWISKENSSSGPYSFVMEKNGLALLFNSEPYWIFGYSGANTTQSIAGTASNSMLVYSVFCWQLDGTVSLDFRTNFSQIEPRDTVEEACQRLAPTDRRMQIPVNGTNFSYASFTKLEPNGDLVIYNWADTFWEKAFNFSSFYHCFLPNSCGAYRICNRTNGKCGATCPSPSSFDISKDQGCIPSASLVISGSRCHEDVDFVELNNVDYFSTSFSAPKSVSISKEDCKMNCKMNCTCRAAFYKERTRTCFETHADVQSLQTGEYVAFIKIASATDQSKRKKLLTVALSILIPAMVLLTGCLVYMFKQRRTDDNLEEEGLELSLQQCLPTRFTYKELQQITNNFSDCLGNGGFGSVYKGGLTDGTEVAVKKLEGSNQKSRDFYAEVAILAKSRHWNLVKLLGFCAEGPAKRLLVYEFMVHGSLERWIFQSDEKPLSWKVRYDIALGTAKGLSYLHEECEERIIHLDLKPENVLLDVGFQPKIADFGLSKLMNREESFLQMTTMRGTPGYVAPECLQDGTVTEKSDVFSFGILLLEIISGCRSKIMTIEYLKHILEENKDDELGNEEVRLQSIVFQCIQDDPDLRPTMKKVVQMMEGLIPVPAAPLASEIHLFRSCKSRRKSSSSIPSSYLSEETRKKLLSSSVEMSSVFESSASS